jgi:carbon storage regulator
MLVITRKVGEEFIIDNHIRVLVKELKGKQVRFGIDAPASVSVYRGEIYRQIEEANLQAAASELGAVRWAAGHVRDWLGGKEEPE